MFVFAGAGLDKINELLTDGTATIKLVITIAVIAAVLYTMFKKHMAFGAIIGVAFAGAFIVWFVNFDGYKALAHLFTLEGGSLM